MSFYYLDKIAYGIKCVWKYRKIIWHIFCWPMLPYIYFLLFRRESWRWRRGRTRRSSPMVHCWLKAARRRWSWLDTTQRLRLSHTSTENTSLSHTRWGRGGGGGTVARTHTGSESAFRVKPLQRHTKKMYSAGKSLKWNEYTEGTKTFYCTFIILHHRV